MPLLHESSAVSGFVRMLFQPSARPASVAGEGDQAIPMAVPLLPAGEADDRVLAVVASLLKTGRQATALTVIERACQEQPLRPEFHNSRALVLKACRRDVEALAAFDRALDLWPEYQEAFYNRQRMLGLVRRRS